MNHTPAATGGRRAVSVLIVTFGLAVVMLAALSALGFLTASDVSSSSSLLRELRATFLAESIAAQIEAGASSRPWSERFWLRQAQATGSASPTQGVVAAATLDRSSPWINLTQDRMPATEYDFVALVKDLPTGLRDYRIYIEVSMKGETYVFSWDKRWQLSLLSGLGRDDTVMDKLVEGAPSAQGPADTVIDTIRTRVDTAPLTDSSGAGQAARVGQLKKDFGSFKASAITPDPRRKPSLSWLSGGGGGGP